MNDREARDWINRRLLAELQVKTGRLHVLTPGYVPEQVHFRISPQQQRNRRAIILPVKCDDQFAVLGLAEIRLTAFEAKVDESFKEINAK